MTVLVSSSCTFNDAVLMGCCIRVIMEISKFYYTIDTAKVNYGLLLFRGIIFVLRSSILWQFSVKRN